MSLWIQATLLYCVIASALGTRTYLGESVTGCNDNELREQLCPDPSNNQDRRYARIKTFNGKYVYALSSSTDNGYAVTKCCGRSQKYPKDNYNPGQGSTFIVFCSNYGGKNTVNFGLLKFKNTRPSGWFLYAGNYQGIYAKKGNPTGVEENQFALHQWRGPVFAVESLSRHRWLQFSDDSQRGTITLGKRVSGAHANFPAFEDTFFIELVPKECVDVRDNEKILASPASNSPDECEARQDRCYWFIKDNNSPKCYYKKDSVCFQPGSKEACPESASNAAECEAANCCYDYQHNNCYKAKTAV